MLKNLEMNCVFISFLENFNFEERNGKLQQNYGEK